MTALRILHLVHQYPPEHLGGTEHYTRALSQQQAAQGHAVAVLAPVPGPGGRKAGERSREDGVTVYRVAVGQRGAAAVMASSFGQAKLRQAVAAALASERPDLVHIQHLKGLPATVAADLKRRQIPYLISLHDYWWVCANAQLLTNYSQELCEGPRGYLNCGRCALARAGLPHQLFPLWPALAVPLAARNGRLRQVIAGAAALVAPSRFVGDWYGEHGVPAGKIRVLPWGLEPPAPASAASDRRQPFRVGYVGGLAWQKGVHVLLEAFAGLEADTAELWLAGDTRFDPAYVARLRRLAGANVSFWGGLDHAEIWQFLAQVDVVVVPSLWYETFNFVVAEAFAAGAPVIASDLGALSERVRPGIDGLLVPPGDVAALGRALRQLQQEDDRLGQLRQGITPVKTMVKHAAEIERLYRQILDGRAGAGRSNRP